MATIKTNGQELEFIESYKGRNIVKSDNGTIMVHDPKGDTLFIVCMDDSKSSGRRTFDEAFNTVQAARDHIDYYWEPMEFIADLDDASGLYCIFNSKLRAVASYADKGEAQREADRLNKQLYSDPRTSLYKRPKGDHRTQPTTMAKRKKEYINLEGFEKVGEVLRLIKKECDLALSCDGDAKVLDDLLENISIRAKVIMRDKDAATTPITPAEQRRLKNAKFTNYHHSGKDYLDYVRTVLGFGETNDDRVELVTFSTFDNAWYGSVRHRDEDGEDWHNALSTNYKKLSDVLDWLAAEREKAPVQKSDVPA